MKTIQTIKVSPFSGVNDGTVEATTVVTIEETNKEPFNWLTVLAALAAGAVIDYNSKDSLLRRAGNWPTCACGQLCQRLERGSKGQPLDVELHSLGMSFSSAVSSHQWALALALFNRIEARTAALLRQ